MTEQAQDQELFQIGDPLNESVSASKLAERLDVNIRSIQDWDKEGFISRTERGTYVVGDFLKGLYWWQRNIINRKQGEEGSKKQGLETQRLEEQVKQLQMENDKLSGKLRDAEKVQRVAFSRGKMEADMLDSLPARLKPILAAETDEFTVGQILKTEIDNIRTKLIEMSTAQW